MNTVIIVTAVGPDRPGIVSRLSEVGSRYGASWAASRMANLAGQFAGMVQFDVGSDQADALASALAALESPELHVVVARGSSASPAAESRLVHLEIVGHDRPGIVKDLSSSLASLGVSIEELQTEVASAAMAGGSLFKVRAELSVPATVTGPQLRRSLEALANEMMVDVHLG